MLFCQSGKKPLSSLIKILYLLSFRNIEEMMEAQGDHVKKVTDLDGTTEVTIEDIVGRKHTSSEES